MYSRFRRWRLEHWALEGEPHTWSAQLEARYRATPVFALLSGISYDDWGRFMRSARRRESRACCRMRGCRPRGGFLQHLFFTGLLAEVNAVAQALAGVREVVVWTEESASGERQRSAIVSALGAHGIGVVMRKPRADDMVIAALPSAQVEAATVPWHIHRGASMCLQGCWRNCRTHGRPRTPGCVYAPCW